MLSYSAIVIISVRERSTYAELWAQNVAEWWWCPTAHSCKFHCRSVECCWSSADCVLAQSPLRSSETRPVLCSDRCTAWPAWNNPGHSSTSGIRCPCPRYSWKLTWRQQLLTLCSTTMLSHCHLPKSMRHTHGTWTDDFDENRHKKLTLSNTQLLRLRR